MNEADIDNNLNTYAQAEEILNNMSDDELKAAWQAVEYYDPSENHSSGLSMKEWAEMVSKKMDLRGFSRE